MLEEIASGVTIFLSALQLLIIYQTHCLITTLSERSEHDYEENSHTRIRRYAGSEAIEKSGGSGQEE